MLTSARDGLDLLWRNDVDPQKVNLGLGWYGRSFTLADPSCNTPGCVFKSGGTPGRCNPSPDAAGTLMNAEIIEIIQQNGLTPVFDKEAAVKWITWNNDQWVSYDDGETTSLKLQAANELCLGGKMIWALDQDDVDSTSNHNLLGLEGLDPELVRELAAAQLQAEVDATTRQSCYWTFCKHSLPVMPSTTLTRGQVVGSVSKATSRRLMPKDKSVDFRGVPLAVEASSKLCAVLQVPQQEPVIGMAGVESVSVAPLEDAAVRTTRSLL